MMMSILSEVREILNDIVTEDQRAGEVIHRLRLLLKKGEPQNHCDDVDLNEVVRDVLKLMRNDLINQNVTVDTDLAQNLPAVTGDRVQLQQVLLNLVLNACEAMTVMVLRSANCSSLLNGERRSAGIRHRSWRRHSGAKNGTSLRAFLHHEKGGNGAWPLRLPHHH